MSARLRNPFRLRASEKIESDASFLRLFSPYVLESLFERHTDGKLWNNILFIRSSPGAGKTSLLRVFEPSSLNTLLNNKSEFKEIHTALKRIEVVSEDKVDVLGVNVSCNRNYQILDDLDIPIINKKRIFFSLLNARLTLSFLRASCKLCNLDFPSGLSAINFKYRNSENYFHKLRVPCNGLELYDWASTIEREVYRAIDSFLPEEIVVEGHDEPFIVSVIKPEDLLLNGQPFCKSILFMLDDAHKLSPEQRQMLEDYLVVKRGNFSLWISERLEALEPKQIVGSFPGRDFDEVQLEKLWQKFPKRFEKILRNIAEKRSNISTEDVNSFVEYLESNLNEQRHKVPIRSSFNKTKTSALKLANTSSLYSNWASHIAELEGTDFNQLITLKQTEIILHRSVNKNQLAIGFPFSVEQLEERMSSQIAGAAEFLSCSKGKIPYYFSFNSLSVLASSNIEQFLSFASELFEEMISNKISGLPIEVSDTSQERIIKEVSSRKWQELPKIIPHAAQVMKFITEFATLAVEETYKENAPYAPGVTGFAIKTSKSNQGGKAKGWVANPSFEPLTNVLSTCVAYNLLELKEEVSQGKKDQTWDVYYLNRWLCVKFDLPIAYGGWRGKYDKELLEWIS